MERTRRGGAETAVAPVAPAPVAPTSASPGPHQLLALQRTIGNRAVASLHGPAVVGRADDRAEGEADRAAAAIMRRLGAAAPPTAPVDVPGAGGAPVIRRMKRRNPGNVVGQPGPKQARGAGGGGGGGGAPALVPVVVAPWHPMPGGWTAGPWAVLGAAFVAANPAGLSAAEWSAIATAHPVLHDSAANVATFARVGGGWTAAGRVNLAGAFGAGDGGRAAAGWAAIAVADATLADAHATVATFARLAGWTTPNVETLATAFGTGAAGRPAGEWAALAAVAAVVDAPAAVAAAARGAWVAVDFAAFAGAFTGAGGAGLPALVAAAAGGLRAGAAAWAPNHLGTFLGHVHVNGATPGQLAAVGIDAGMPAGVAAMAARGWTPAHLGTFTGCALTTGATEARLFGLMATANAPDGCARMVAGGMTLDRVGRFCGGALLSPAGFGTLERTFNSQDMPAAADAMAGAGGMGSADLGRCTGAARAAGARPGWLSDVFRQATAPADAQAALAHWSTDQLGALIAGMDAVATPADRTARCLHLPPASTAAWRVAGFTSDEVGQLVGRAAQAASFAGVSGFLATGGAAAAAFALRNGTWTASELGRSIGSSLAVAGGPSDAQLVVLLQRCLAARANAQIGAACTPTALRNATAAAVSSWTTVAGHWLTFINHWAGAAAAVGVAVLHSARWNNPLTGTVVDLSTSEDLETHVRQGHTFEGFDLSHANCVRAAQSSFFPVGTDVRARLTALPNAAGLTGTAQQVAQTGVRQQADFGGIRHGIVFVRQGQTADYVRVSQYYPRPGTDVDQADLLAIGRLSGRFA